MPLTWKKGDNPVPQLFDDPNYKPPCRTGQGCPKISPERQHEVVLSARNEKTVKLFHLVRLTAGGVLTDREKSDPLLLHNLSICDEVYREFDAFQERKRLVDVMNTAFSIAAQQR